MAKRHKQAVQIQDGGASNPSAISRALVDACDEAHREGVAPYTDAAVRLIAHQLCFVLRVYELERDFEVHRSLMDECRAKADS